LRDERFAVFLAIEDTVLIVFSAQGDEACKYRTNRAASGHKRVRADPNPGIDVRKCQLQKRRCGLCGGVFINIFFLRVVDANQRFDRFNHTLRIAHEILVYILGS
jgi:hypothetical protein